MGIVDAILHLMKSREEKKDTLLSSIYTKTSKEWKKIQEQHIVTVFKETSKDIKAYKAYLKKSNIQASRIRSYADFDSVPTVTKKNYLRAYRWDELCHTKTRVGEPVVMTSTSGSTGAPFYFPRTGAIDMQSSVYHEMFFLSSGLSKKKSTLIVNCFGMGVWIGGLITYQAFKHLGERGVPLTIITPGISKHEIFQALKNLGPHYEQIVLCGYPPFMKDVIDQAKDHGIRLHDWSIKIIFAAEGFSESFRDYIVKHAGIKNIYRDTMNIYGSADLGTMAIETPLCILLRRLALTNKKLYLRLFGQATRLPTLAQYIPEFISFEERAGSICCTAKNVLPLVRYEIGDSGEVLSYDHIVKVCQEEGVNLQKEITQVRIEDTITQLPFVSIYERSDFSTKLYGAIIYPEYIKKGLHRSVLRKQVTGKFTMCTKFDDQEDEYLEVNVELQPKVKETKSLRDEITQSISKALIQGSAEHKNNTTLMSHGKVEPKIIFWSYEHEAYFKTGGKQKWVKK